MALYIDGKKIVNSLVIDGNAYDKAVIFEGTASTNKWAEPLVYSSVNALDYEVLCFSGTDSGNAFKVYYNIADLPISPNPVQDDNHTQFSQYGYLYVDEDGVLYFCVSTTHTLVLNEVLAYKTSDVGGGGSELHLLYSLEQTQGGQWFNTGINTTQYDKLLFINSVNGDDGYMREIAISDIIVVNSGTANDYTEVFSEGAIGKMFICHIYNNELWVGYNASGSSGNVVGVYEEVNGGGCVFNNVPIYSGKIDLTTGNVVSDDDYYYTDLIDAPNGAMIFDLGETSSGTYVGVEMCGSDGSHKNYWSANERYRQVNHSSYYSQAPKLRLSFRKIYLEKVLLLDKVNDVTYSGKPVIIGNI